MSEQLPQSGALEINLERTRAVVEIPARYGTLLAAARDHYGLRKRTEDLLLELNHPFVNWEYVLTQLKTISIGDFYDFNTHAEGPAALGTLADIYLSVLDSGAGEEVKENAVRHLCEYLNTILSGSGPWLARNAPLFPPLFGRLGELALTRDDLLQKSSGYLKATARLVVGQRLATDWGALQALLGRVFAATYRFWLTQPDPAHWFPPEGRQADREVYAGLVEPLSHARIAAGLARLDQLDRQAVTGAEGLAPYLEMPDHLQIANGYLRIADALEQSAAFAGHRYPVKLDFLFNVMAVPGLTEIHKTALAEINRCLGRALAEQGPEESADFVRKVFRLLKRNVRPNRHQGSIIDCVTTLAKEVLATGNHPLVDTLIAEMVDFGFQPPDLQGSTTDWQIRVNPAHIQNIRAWLEIISLNPRWTKRLLSALIIHLQVEGIFVRDTDLLQKEISRLLNADIQPVYNLVKQLLRLFPIFFSEIGAEGELRTISTAVDELSARSDGLIHFLRKQSHVESNSRLVPFIEEIFRYWASGDKRGLRQHLPDEVYREVPTEGENFADLHRLFSRIVAGIHGNVPEMLAWDGARIARETGGVPGVRERERERAARMIRFYQLLYKKYFHQHIDILRDLETANLVDGAAIGRLRRALARRDPERSLRVVLALIAALKGRVLSPQKTDYFENIYYKRHIAAGIPSMYGTYREEKFEALGLILRLESLATTLFEKLSESLNLKFITKSTLTQIHQYLGLYLTALDLEGLATEGLASKLSYITSALKIRQFSIDQYIDIFQFIAKGIQDITRDYCIDPHRENLSVIVGRMACPAAGGDGKSAVPQGQEAFYRTSENVVRAIVSAAFGLQVLDNFVNAITRALRAELEKFKDNKKILNLVMAYIPELAITTLYRKNRATDNQILIGNKAYLLKALTAYGLPVPPGFVITTEVFRGFEGVMAYKHILKDLRRRVYREIQQLERITGKKFGDPHNPLLLSVRSGATISLPGMMCSYLNVGINEGIAAGLAENAEHRWAAWDSYRRFLQTWGMFQGIERNIFDEVMSSSKRRYSVAKKIQFNPEEMRAVALSYREAIRARGVRITENPFRQLQHAILEVFASWDSEQARIYRHQMHLSDEWGTAVIVQAMVFGNLNENSGSGVIFTRDPRGSSQEIAIYGDFIFGVQGEDIVSGLVETYPISERQREAERREVLISLETKFPEIYQELVRIAEFLVVEKGFSHQEIEFTFENATRKGLHLLQTRDMVQRERGTVRSFIGDGNLEKSFLGMGIGVSGGALAGRVVYSEEEIARFRQLEPETPLILIRPDTVPEDVGIILKVEGILTARGGGTSHAAVTIPQLNKVGVVGFNKLHVYESACYSRIDGRIIRGGDFISIDGWSGSVYSGRQAVGADESFKICL